MARTPRGETRERVLHFVRQRLLEGQPPTVREVQQHLGFRAVESAREHLEALVAEGRLAKESGRSRGYRLPVAAMSMPEGPWHGVDLGRQRPQTSYVPLLGRVQAGALTFAAQELEGYVAVEPRGPVDQDELFGLRVRGQSMRDAGILPDDIVIVRRQSRANSGDIVVAIVEDEATIKRLRLRPDCVELLPENSEFSPIHVALDAFVMVGKVIEVRRYFEAVRLDVLP
jgi:repressor LexA